MAKRSFVTDKQKNQLLEIFENDPNLRSGKFSSTFTYKDAQMKWENIKLELNLIPGAYKTAVQWKKTWQDLKKNLKKKSTDLRKHAGSTGGGPPLNISFSSQDEKVANILGETALYGDQKVAESIIIDIIPDTEAIENQEKEPEPENMEDNEPVEVTAQSEVIENTVLQEPKRKKCSYSKKQIMSSAVNTSEILTEVAEKDVEIKTKYYENKLSLLQSYYQHKLDAKERELELKEREMELRAREVAIHEQISNSLIIIIERNKP